jgi:sporulation protein YlmC with PRC-barrel domain
MSSEEQNYDIHGGDRPSVTRLQLGNAVHCADGVYGELADVVIDPLTRRVTHLVVAPQHRHDLARLVAVARARAGAGSDAEIRLDYTSAEVSRLEPLQKSAYLRLGELPVEDPDWDVGIENLLALPYFGSFATGGLGAGVAPLGLDDQVAEVYDRVPKDKIEIRRASAVISRDERHLGHVDGFVVDGQELITHLVLERGHVWGKREITIPIHAVANIKTDEVQLRLSKDEVADLESVPIRRWSS